MTRKLILLLLVIIGLQSKLFAAPGDSVRIYIQPYTDTSCYGAQLRFTETDTFAGATVRWYINSTFIGVTLDTFFTTAPNDGDSIFCMITLPGGLDSARSNAITVHRSDSVPARALVALIAGSNPDCAGYPLTFEVYPVNGGTNPRYQWMINGIAITGADSTTFTRYFGGADTVSCRMISNSPCAPEDTVYSTTVPIIHIHLTAALNIITYSNPICVGTTDTFQAIASSYGNVSLASYQWYVNNVAVPGAISPIYITDTLSDGDSVFCVFTTADSCVLNPTVKSNVIHMIVNHYQRSSAFVNLIAGSNPGCIDSPVTFEAIYDSLGYAPYFEWTINGSVVLTMSDTIKRIFNNNDVVAFHIRATDGGCYTQDTINVPGVMMIRDTAPPAPLVSLIGNQLYANNGTGSYRWYYNAVNSTVGATLIPGANGVSYHPARLGYYYAMNDSSYCPSAPSNIIYISLLKVNDLEGADISVYPNPSQGIINLDWGTTVADLQFAVYSVDGKEMYRQAVSSKTTRSVDLSALPAGSYFLVFSNGVGKSTKMIQLEH